MCLDLGALKNFLTFLLIIQHRPDDSKFKGHDMNVVPVWKQGITGKGVVVSILDDG